jgi:hypothetical protein
MKIVTEKAKKEHFVNIYEDITEFQRTGRYDLLCINKKETGWKEIQGIQNIVI